MSLVFTCDRCRAACGPDDAFCPACGFALLGDFYPVQATPSRALVRWQGAAPALLQGAALAGAGFALRFALPKVAGVAARRVIGRKRTKKAPINYIEEHIVRRVWIKR